MQTKINRKQISGSLRQRCVGRRVRDKSTWTFWGWSDNEGFKTPQIVYFKYMQFISQLYLSKSEKNNDVQGWHAEVRINLGDSDNRWVEKW